MRATVNEEHKHGNRSKHAKSTPSPKPHPPSSKENMHNFTSLDRMSHTYSPTDRALARCSNRPLALAARKRLHDTCRARLGGISFQEMQRWYLISGDAALTIERWYRGCLGRARYVPPSNLVFSFLSISYHFHVCQLSFPLPKDGGDFARLRLACFLQTPFACRSTDVSTSDPGVVLSVSKRKSVAELFVRSMLLPRFNHSTVCMSAILPTRSSNPRPLHYKQKRYLKKLSPRRQIHHSRILSSLHAHLSMSSLNCYILLLQKKT